MTPEDAVTYQRLDKSWNLVLAQLKSQNPSLNALVNSVKARSLKGNTLTLGMSGEVLKMRLEDPANIALLENVLKQVMGQGNFCAGGVNFSHEDHSSRRGG